MKIEEARNRILAAVGNPPISKAAKKIDYILRQYAKELIEKK